MGRIVFFIAEAIRALRRSAAPSLAAVVTIGVTTVLLGVLIPVLSASASTNQNVRTEIAQMRVFLKDGGSPGEIKALKKRISRIPHVERVAFISKDEAKQRLKDQLGGNALGSSIDELKRNPLPASFDVHFDDPDNRQAVTRKLYKPGSGQQFISPLIDNVNAGGENAGKIDKITGNLKIFLVALAALLLIASLLLVANTIRLSIYARRREVEVMRFVGATNWFIRWPFVLEGIVVGLMGALIAVGILWVGKVVIVDPLNNFELIRDFSTVAFAPLIIGLLGSAVLVSAMGSGVALGRFLRV